MDLRQVAALVRSGTLAPEALVLEARRRIERLDSAINAVTDTCWEQAIDAARRHDRQGRLAGLPVLVKDLVVTRGMANRLGGFELMANASADAEDDETVSILVEEGAIVVGRSNSPSLGASGTTANALFGATRNPWNLDRSPCGSSGGAGAALAAGLTAIATSSDGGGSTRCPAAACGVVGLKPTAGTFVHSRANRSLGTSGVGAMGISVDDCLLEAEILARPGAGNLFAPPPGTIDFSFRKPRRAIAQANLFKGPTPAHLRVLFDAACQLVDRVIGIPVEQTDRIDFGPYMQQFACTFAVELKRALLPVRDRWEELGGAVRHILERNSEVTAMDIVDAYMIRPAIAAEIDKMLVPDTVLLCLVNNFDMPDPFGATPDMPQGFDPGVWSVEQELKGLSNTAFFNISGHPAISVPIGTGPDGVPVGLQIVAPRWADGMLFALARAIEEAQPWPRSAPGYQPFASGL
jgi:Asp-tRNA(Asn)/Glu-tRNA(Gln) amidotransferase A subunit family amidase